MIIDYVQSCEAKRKAGRFELFRFLAISVALNLTALCAQSVLAAAAISPEFVEQAKKMPPAQREALARQLGLNQVFPISEVGSSFPISQSGSQVTIQKPREDIAREAIEVSDDARQERSLARFGARLFEKDGPMFEPSNASAVPQNYLLGPGDSLLITFFGKITAQYNVVIAGDGSVVVPDLGPLQVAGLTFKELKQFAKNIVAERLIGTEIFISPGEVRKISVMVVGEAKYPGQYNLSALSNPLHALYLAGGPTEIGSYRNIRLSSVGGESSTLDLYSLLLSGNPVRLPLRDGDILHIPPAAFEVGIHGEVVRAAIYELKGDSTFKELLIMAGGPTPQAYEKGTVLQRSNSMTGSPSVLQIDGFRSDLRLVNGDQIVVPASSQHPNNSVRISGALAQTGLYEYKDGLRVGDYLPSLEANYLPESDLSRGLIVRRLNDEHDIEVLSFSPVSASKRLENEENPRVQANDELIILPLSGLEPPQNSGLPGAESDELEGQSVDRSNSYERELSWEREQHPSQPGLLGNLSGDSRVLEASRFMDRSEFLKPIIEKLKKQAEPGQPAKIVNIYGAVNEPGAYPLIEGEESVRILLSLAGGIRNGAYLGSVEVRRRNFTSGRVENVIRAIDLSVAGSFQPQALDELRLNYLPGWRERETVNLIGEIEFPGEYVLTPGETISSLIERAGGFTDDAFVDALRFRSASAKAQQQLAVDRVLLQIQKSTALVPNSQQRLASDSEVQLTEGALGIEVEGRIVIDVPRILAGDPSADIAVQDGDEILVPRVSEVIYVVGEVLEPGNYRHVEGTSLEQYINLAAGFTAMAKKKDVYFILPNGRVQRANEKQSLLEFKRDSIEIVAGTTIVVPPNLNYAQPLEFYTRVSSVVFQSMASIAAFFSLARN
jgi:polysaccharide export outer membrane protein